MTGGVLISTGSIWLNSHGLDTQNITSLDEKLMPSGGQTPAPYNHTFTHTNGNQHEEDGGQ